MFALVATGIGPIYYFGPDAEQDWAWITPGAIASTMPWLLVSLLFKVYVVNFTDYEGPYGGEPQPAAVVRIWLAMTKRVPALVSSAFPKFE